MDRRRTSGFTVIHPGWRADHRVRSWVARAREDVLPQAPFFVPVSGAGLPAPEEACQEQPMRYACRRVAPGYTMQPCVESSCLRLLLGYCLAGASRPSSSGRGVNGMDEGQKPRARGSSAATQTGDWIRRAFRQEPVPEPPYRLIVPEDTTIHTMRNLISPPGTRVAGGTGGPQNAVYCVRADTKPGEVPIREGPSVWFHPNGRLRAQGMYHANKRTGIWIEWDEEGRKRAVIGYREGEYDGFYLTYWPNGLRQSEIEYSGGKKHGVAKTWGDDAKLLNAKRYDNDELVDEVSFRPDGTPVIPKKRF